MLAGSTASATSAGPPSAQDSAFSGGGESDEAAPKLGRILLLDDDPLFRGTTAALLADAGHAVCDAGDPDAALSMLQEQAFDLLMLDVVMPAIGGDEFAAEARALRPGLQILFMTGYAAAPPGERWFLQKPFRRADLLAAVAEILPD